MTSSGMLRDSKVQSMRTQVVLQELFVVSVDSTDQQQHLELELLAIV